MVTSNKRPVSYALKDLYFSAHRNPFFAIAFLRSPFCVSSLICQLTLQRSLSSLRAHRAACLHVRKLRNRVISKPLLFHRGWHKVSTRGNSAKLLHPTEEIKSSAKARLMCQAEERKPKGHGILESSRRGTIMIWWAAGSNSQTNCCDSR